MENLDLFEWVNRSDSSADKAFRQAVHVLILAVSQSNSLKTRMIFHGGLLLNNKSQKILCCIPGIPPSVRMLWQ